MRPRRNSGLDGVGLGIGRGFGGWGQAVRPRGALRVVAAVRRHARAEGGTSVLEHGKRRGIYRNFDAERLDLGNEPPLSVDGETRGEIDRRRVSVQWFSGTILTGLCGAALMGGAVF